jgi:hypothetical protein
MKVYGLDFTSAPRSTKAITCAKGELRHSSLRIIAIDKLCSLAAFEQFLNQDGPWVAGIDFPFGQPRKLIKNLAWPDSSWEDYVDKVAAMRDVKEFEDTLAQYRKKRVEGDKQHLRIIDIWACSRSPMMMYGVPVGRMFFHGGSRLRRSAVSILPCRRREDNRLVVEAYPALVARNWIPGESYKNDKKQKQTPELEEARRGLVRGLRSDELESHYGIQLELDSDLADVCIGDATGDHVDAVLCAIQAAWAYSQRDHKYGIPNDVDRLEGWIVDPAMKMSKL